MTDRPVRIAIWCAASSKHQAGDDKISLEDQERAGREFARAIGGHIVRIYRIPGHTRDLIFWTDAEATMPAYRQLRQDCENANLDILHAIDPDRLGRDPALSNQVVSLVEKSGAEVYLASAPHTIGQKTVGARYVYAIQSVRAGEEQRRRVRYYKAGIRKRIQRGLHLNHWPLGYRAVRDDRGKTIGAEFDDHIGAVKLATGLYLRGETYQSIATVLDASIHRPPYAQTWRYGTVRDMMLNDIYAGYVTAGDVRNSQPSAHFPALWDTDTYRAVLRERGRREKRTGRRGAGSPLYQVAICSRCGGNMIRRSSRAYRLRCSTHQHSRTCHNNQIKEDLVLKTLLTWLADHNNLDALAAALTSHDTRDLPTRLAEIGRTLENLEQKRQRLALALASGHLDPQMYRTSDDILLEDLDKLQTERATLEARLTNIPDLGVSQQTITHLLANRPDMTNLEINTALLEIGIRIGIENRQITYIRLEPHQ